MTHRNKVGSAVHLHHVVTLDEFFADRDEHDPFVDGHLYGVS